MPGSILKAFAEGESADCQCTPVVLLSNTATKIKLASMTVKTAVNFTERHHRFAKQKVEEGSCASVSGLVAQGIEKLMQEEEEREAVLAGMADAVRARMQTPRSEFIEMDENDTMFDDIRNRLTS